MKKLVTAALLAIALGIATLFLMRDAQDPQSVFERLVYSPMPSSVDQIKFEEQDDNYFESPSIFMTFDISEADMRQVLEHQRFEEDARARPIFAGSEPDWWLREFGSESPVLYLYHAPEEGIILDLWVIWPEDGNEAKGILLKRTF